MAKSTLEKLVDDLRDADLGDSRRTDRLGLIVERVTAKPGASFPELSRDSAELEGLYRFFRNEHVTPEAILEPHFQACVGRASTEESVLVLHDTTYFTFRNEREGLGRIQTKNHGFWAHYALAITADRQTLGVAGLRYGTRHGPSRWKGSRRIEGVGDDEPSEHLRWPGLVADVAERFGAQKVLHVMDREADWFELFKQMVESSQRFVVRLTHDRLVEDGYVSDLWETTDTVVLRQVRLSGRAEGSNARRRKRHPARKPREAKLQIQGARSRVRSSTSKGELSLAFVRVLELDPPDGCAPVVWNLITTEDVETEADLLRVVDAYRARWVVEEFFKALKTGCAFEKRQLGSYEALLNALAVLSPIACGLLRLRDCGRRFPDHPGNAAIRPELLAILRQLGAKPLPDDPTAREVMFAVAALGGHYKPKLDPGWITLGRGFQRLIEAEDVLRRCDQR